MAKIFFENRFILTKKLHHQYCKETYRLMNKRIQLLSLISALVMYGLFLFSALYLRLAKLAGVFLIIAIYFTAMIFLGYTFSEWYNFRKLKDDYGQAITMVLHFEQDKVNVRVNEKSFSFKYSSIYKAYETEDLIILILGKQGMVEQGQVIFKNGFTGHATLEDFKGYINKKTKEVIFND